jgi:bacterioferritin-associated ferredoxin
MYVCVCNSVTESQVQERVQAGVCTVDELALELGVGAGCGRCRQCAAECLQACVETQALSPA